MAPKASAKVSKSPKAAKVKKASVPKADKPKRAPSAYNIFMKKELAKVKAAQPDLPQKDAFKVVAGNWAKSPENPKNKK